MSKTSYKIIHKGKTVEEIIEYQKKSIRLWNDENQITFWKDKFDDFVNEVLRRHKQEILDANVLENINKFVLQTDIVNDITFYGKLDYEIQDKGKTLKIFELKEKDLNGK